MSVSRKALIDALWKRSRSVIAHVEGEAVYLLEDAALALKAPVENAATLAAAVKALDAHGWTTAGADTAQCVCGVVIGPDTGAGRSTADSVPMSFRTHIAKAVLDAVEAAR